MASYIRRGQPSEHFPSHQNFHFSAKNLLDEKMQEQDLFLYHDLLFGAPSGFS